MIGATAPFFAGAIEGQLLLPRCLACGQPHWYPRAICPHCSSDRITWDPSNGEGIVYSYSVLRRATPPYVLACVTLDEGITILTRIVDCELDAVAIDMPVRVVFRVLDGVSVPVWAPR